jgi:hypothetical protein
MDTNQTARGNKARSALSTWPRELRASTGPQEEASLPTTPFDATVVDPGGTLERVSSVDVDPALAEQLALAADTERVEVVLVLRQSGVDTDQHSEAETLVRQAAADVPPGAVEYSVLPQLGVLIVRAPARVIRWLITQPAVAIASANRMVGMAD